jgi:diguanylate cyclase (GGDEF)-like protein/PAS domain S-box-containing protein
MVGASLLSALRRAKEAKAAEESLRQTLAEKREIERRIQESEQRLRILAEASFEGVAITREGVVLDTNEVFARWLGRDPEELIGEEGLSLFAPEDRAHVVEMSGRSGDSYEAQMVRKDGSRFPVEVRGTYTKFRGQSVRIAVVRDITERRRREAELRTQAELLRGMSLRDELTGLYNRRGFQELTEQQLRAATRSKRPASLFFVDLNGMKSINDTHGHEIGDRALVDTAKILTDVFRNSDVVARLGGDEFAVLALECGPRDTGVIIERLSQHVERLNKSGKAPFRLSLAVGSAAFDPARPMDLNELIEEADRRMYADKRAKKSAIKRRSDEASGVETFVDSSRPPIH